MSVGRVKGNHCHVAGARLKHKADESTIVVGVELLRKMRMARRTLLRTGLLVFVLLIGAGIAVAALLNVRIPGLGGAGSDEERILHIARHIARTYDNRPAGAEYYGILYSRRLPGLVRLPTGFLETLTHARDCDSMVRALIYLAAREGIEARQSDIFAPTFVHSVAEVRIADRWVLVDPYLGVVFRRADGTLAAFETIKVDYAELKQDGLRAEDRVAGAAKFFYSRLAASIIAESGTEVAMPLRIAASQLPATIGELDASNDDVVAALVDGAMGPIGSFLGPRLGSGKHTWLKLTDKPVDAELEIRFELTENSETPPSVASTPAGACTPQSGALTCRLPAGVTELIIRHGDWSRVYTVDRIRVRRVS